MTLKEFSERAIKIGCEDKMVSVLAETNRYSHGESETTYQCYCAFHKYTKTCPTPEEALREFERMHGMKQESVDMAISLDEPEKPVLLRKIMD